MSHCVVCSDKVCLDYRIPKENSARYKYCLAHNRQPIDTLIVHCSVGQKHGVVIQNSGTQFLVVRKGILLERGFCRIIQGS